MWGGGGVRHTCTSLSPGTLQCRLSHRLLLDHCIPKGGTRTFQCRIHEHTLPTHICPPTRPPPPPNATPEVNNTDAAAPLITHQCHLRCPTHDHAGTEGLWDWHEWQGGHQGQRRLSRAHREGKHSRKQQIALLADDTRDVHKKNGAQRSLESAPLDGV
jgi:hypothetical protein